MFLYKAFMILTLVCAVGTLLFGVASMGRVAPKESQQADNRRKSNRLMMLRVGLCALLLAEILVYSLIS